MVVPRNGLVEDITLRARIIFTVKTQDSRSDDDGASALFPFWGVVFGVLGREALS